MNRQILLRHEATAIAAKNGLAGLPELAQHLHLEKGARRGEVVINMDHSDDPTSTVGFYFSPAAGEGGIIMATAGASHEENGLEGCRFLFQSHGVAEAQRALLAELNDGNPELTRLRPEFRVAATVTRSVSLPLAGHRASLHKAETPTGQDDADQIP